MLAYAALIALAVAGPLVVVYVATRGEDGAMPLPDDWHGRPSINDVSDLADDDPNRCPETGHGHICHRPAGHNAEGFGHFDNNTRTVWWPETITRERRP
jgi:hypothetical protein